MMQTAVVTGAGSGIGRACALGLLAEGWQVALLGRRADALQATADAAGENASRALVLPCNVADDQAVAAAFNAVQQRFGRLDLLFNNAGGGLGAKTPDLVSAEEWRQVVDVNLNGAFYCLSNAFRLMRAQTPMGGRIINNGSISAYAPRPGSMAYTATKHAVSGLTKTASLDGRPFNIAVGQIDIGNAASELTARMAEGVPQADGSIRPEPRMDLQSVVDTFMAMARLPLSSNVLFTTVMATNMPYIGRG
ncbi:MAG: SDR family oxidoreductase [Hydrogenophaga sp.]|jgi:NAD(P)-dependent dehydrogenase (short-subunit alcohol dehydrogenase family)|nr:SDR family oxidoreductase [Hydrogenophaga sp.]